MAGKYNEGYQDQGDDLQSTGVSNNSDEKAKINCQQQDKLFEVYENRKENSKLLKGISIDNSNKDWQLDPNQSYYYFADRDVKPRVDTEFIKKLNRMLLAGNSYEKKKPIPCAVFLIGGGQESLQSMQNLLCQNESTTGKPKPVVIIMKGSGQLANLLSSIFEEYQKMNNEVAQTEIECTEEEDIIEEHRRRNSDKAVETAVKLARENMNEENGNSTTPFYEALEQMTKKFDEFKELIREFITMKEKAQIIVFELERGCGSKIDLESVLLESMQGGKEELISQDISFDLYEHSDVKANPSKYSRTSSEISDEALWKNFTKDVWDPCEYPEFAITFLGGSKTSLLADETKECLKKCITSILEKFKCCFITRGSYVGVTKLVGKICSTELLEWNYGCKGKSIGVLPWSKVYERKKLAGDQVLYPEAGYDEKDWVLDPNHSYYYLVTGDPFAKPRVDSKFIMRLNKMLLNGNKEKKAKAVPCAMILTGGAEESLQIMQNFLCQNESKDGKPKPVVIVLKGSGGFADLLSSIFEFYETATLQKTKAENMKQKEQLRTQIWQINTKFLQSAIACAQDVYGNIPQEDSSTEKQREKVSSQNDGNMLRDAINYAVDKCKEDYEDEDVSAPFHTALQEMKKDFGEFKKKIGKFIEKKKEKQIIVFELRKEYDSKNDLEQVLLNAMTDAVKSTKSEFLFAIYANRTKIVREYFKRDESLAFDMMTNSILKSDDLYRVKELLEKYKFNVKSYVAKQEKELYYLDEKHHRPRVIVSEFDPEELNEFYKNHFRGNTEDDGQKCNLLDLQGIYFIMYDLTDGNTVYPEEEMNEKMNPIQKLFVNSILFLDVNAAKLFWNFDPYNPLSNALLAYVLLNGLKNKAKKVSKLAPNDFKDNLKHFELLINALLETYYKIDKDMAEKALTQTDPLWNGRRLIDVAGEIGLKSVFREQACQKIVDQEWGGEKDEKQDSESGNSSKDAQNSCAKKMMKGISKRFFWFNAPIWKMKLHLAVYLVSLVLFAFFVLFSNTVAHDPIQWVVAFVVLSLAVDEIRQITDIGKGAFWNLKQWWSSIWNKFDLLAILLFFVGIGTSFYFKYLSKVLLSFYLLVSCLKVLQFLRTFQTIGVYLVMIREMVGRTKMFMVIFLVSILGYGLFMTALLHPEAKLDWTILFHILFRPSLVLIGEPGVESFEFGNNNTVFGTKKVDAVSEVLVLIAMAAFLLFANILLVNLLIAEFSNIHGEVSSSSEEIWKYEQYLLLVEFQKKPSLPIPFSIFQNLYWLLVKLWGLRCGKPDCMKKKEDQEEKSSGDDGRKIANGKKDCMKKTEDQQGERSGDDDDKERRNVAEFERFCFKKRFPTIPNTVIYPGFEESMRTKDKIPVDA